MSRPLRLEYAGAFWHVTARGNERREIFRSDDDRTDFLRILGRTVTLYRWRLHAYVLMGNHYHILVETPEPTLSRGMRQLNGLYTQGFNRRYRRVGHLFQGRFKAILVEKDAHLLELARYVVLNPVRAALVKSAAAWTWSSYRATAGIEKAPPWLETHATLISFGVGRSRSIEKYRAFVSEGRRGGYEPWEMVEGQIYLGGDAFHREIDARLARMKTSDQIPVSQRKPRRKNRIDVSEVLKRALGTSLGELRAQPRKLIRERRLFADFLRRERLMPMKDIGALLGVKPWQASALARAGEESHDPRSTKLINHMAQT
ncbi:MAG: transposase [Acidobacteriota bacterium]